MSEFYEILIDFAVTPLPLMAISDSAIPNYVTEYFFDKPPIYRKHTLTTSEYNLSRNLQLITSILPLSATRSALRFDLYTRKKPVKPAILTQIKAEVTRAISALSENQPEPTRSGVQCEILALLKSHLKLEQLQGTEIHPAAQQTGVGSCKGKAEMCKCNAFYWLCSDVIWAYCLILFNSVQ